MHLKILSSLLLSGIALALAAGPVLGSDLKAIMEEMAENMPLPEPPAMSELIVAVLQLDEQKVRRLLDNGVDPNVGLTMTIGLFVPCYTETVMCTNNCRGSIEKN